MFKVYKIDNCACYVGFSLVAAESAEEAMEIIGEFKERDTGNSLNSYGHYSKVYESDVIDGLFSERKGLIHNGIEYIG